MKSIEQECGLCRNHDGRCLVCDGTGSIGTETHRGRSIGRDITGRRFNAFRADGSVVYSRDSIVDVPCSVCQETGRCLRCRGKGTVAVPAVPLAIPGGPANRLKLQLREDHWQHFLDNLCRENHMDRGNVAEDGSPKIRSSVVAALDALGDREIEELRHFLDHTFGKKGCEYKNYVTRKSQRNVSREEVEDSLAKLCEQGFVEIVQREDSSGPFAAIEPGSTKEARLLAMVLLHLVEQQDI